PRASATGRTRAEAGARSPAGSTDRSVVPGITGTTSTPRSARGCRSRRTLRITTRTGRFPLARLRGLCLCEGRLERLLELGEAERLHEVGARPELERLPLGREDAGEDHGAARGPETACARETVGVARLDHGCVDEDARVLATHDGLVAGTPDNVCK